MVRGLGVVALVSLTTCAVADRPIAHSGSGEAAREQASANVGWTGDLAAHWADRGVQPVAEVDDATFLRRATLDLLGRIPTSDELLAYAADPDDRRARVVDRMLADPAWPAYWADVYTELLLEGAERRRIEALAPGLRAWLYERLAADASWDVIAFELVSATGDASRGPAAFVAAHWQRGQMENLTGRTARVFLGLSVQCAQCHDHPDDDRYSQRDFYGLAASFARTHTRRSRDGEGARFEVIDRRRGQMRMPTPLDGPGARSGPPIAPAFPGLASVPEGEETRREALARAIVGSPLLDAAFVDRTWAQLLGRGLAEPWDDLGAADDPRQPPTLRSLAGEFAVRGRSLRWLLREIVLSPAYGRASAGPREGSDERREAFAQFSIRPMSDDQLLASLLVATGAEQAHAPRLRRVVRRRRTQLERQFAVVFEDDEMATARQRGASVSQALLLLNGPVTSFGTMASGGTTLAHVLDEHARTTERIDAIFAITLGRPPSAARRRALAAFVDERGGETSAYEDLMHALLVSSEFVTVH